MSWTIYEVKAKADWMLINSNEKACVKQWLAIDSLHYLKKKKMHVYVNHGLKHIYIVFFISINAQQNCLMLHPLSFLEMSVLSFPYK